MDADSLLVDNRAAAVRVTEHLIEHGHRNILCMAEDEKIFTLTERVSGYSEAMRRSRLPVRVCLVGSISGSVSDQLNLALHSSPTPTAIFATRNVIAVEVLRELQKRSVKMPEEMALVAFDDFDAAALVRPRITVEVRLTRADRRVCLSVSDNGIGFAGHAEQSGGLGLINMRERVCQLQGTLEFESEPGRGTTVRSEVPFRPAS